MKTCVTRFIKHWYVYCQRQSFSILAILFLCTTVGRVGAQCPTPELECSTYIVSCADPAAQLVGDPGYLPNIVDSCGRTTFDLRSIAWPEALDKCEGAYSHRIFRKWQLGTNPTVLCTDTILVVNVNINSDSLICPGGRDTIICGSEFDPFDSIELRAPMYGIPLLDTFPLLEEGSGEFCGVFVNLSESVWSNCGNTKTVIRQWELHDLCGRDTICHDTIVLIDTLAPMATFDPELNVEMHTFADFSGMFRTDTIGMSSVGCVGHGIIPYATVTDNCSDASDVKVHISSPENGIYLHYKADEVKTLSVWNVAGEKAYFIYKYTDDCHNSKSDTIVIVVNDQTPAVAACHDAVNLSLTNVDQFTFMKSASLDAESYDNCYIYQILARRTDWQTACGYIDGGSSAIGDYYQQFSDWALNDGGICTEVFEFGFTDKVPFCCADVGKAIMVEILVIDQNCNADKCWGMVYVEDKIVPIVIDPLVNVTITCNAYADLYESMFVDSDTTAIRESFGKYVSDVFEQESWTLTDLSCTMPPTEIMTIYQDGLVDDNCGSQFRERYTLPESGCATGQIRRDFVALISGSSGVVEEVFATQWITVERCALSDMEIVLEVEDTTIYDCGVTYGLDGNVTILTPGPTLPTSLPDCSQFGIGFFDKVFAIVSGDACNKVLRTWCVVDWCNVDFSSGADWASIAHQEGVLTFNQTIKIKDTLPPDINVLSMVADVETINCSSMVNSEIDVTDACLIEPLVSWYMKDANGKSVDQGTGKIAAPTNPLLPGAYTLLWRATDACRNTAEELTNFTISSEAAPSVIGLSSITAVLTPMDTNSNGIIDIGMAEVWAREFNLSSAPPCGGNTDNLIFLIDRGVAGPTSPIPSNDKTALTFSCEDFISNQTPVQVQFWVKDTVQNTADYANVIVLLEDNDGVCGGGTVTPAVGVKGKIFTAAKDDIADVAVRASDDQNATQVTTTTNGEYQLMAITGNAIRLEPTKDDDHSNGISTVDLIKMQRHILGLRSITDPYKMIAADANRDGKINSIDLIQLRKVLLGKIDRLPENTSWRFIDALHDFAGPVSPLLQNFNEHIDLHVEPGQNTHDFVGVKIGDLDDNVVTSHSGRNAKDYELISLLDQQLTVGQTVEVPIYLHTDLSIYGLQMTLALVSEWVQLVDVRSEVLDISRMTHQYKAKDQTKINVSWSDPAESYLSDGAPIMVITLQVHKNGRLSDLISIDHGRMESILILPKDQLKSIKITFEREVNQAFKLSQNRPNPFTSQTVIDFAIPQASEASLKVYDAMGHLVHSQKAHYQKGLHQVTLTNEQLIPGLLYYELRTAHGTKTKKMMLLE